MGKVVVTVELTDNNYSAFIEELPGCISTGKTLRDLKENMSEAVAGHLEVSTEYGDPIPDTFLCTDAVVALGPFVFFAEVAAILSRVVILRAGAFRTIGRRH